MTDEETVKRVLGCQGRGICQCRQEPEFLTIEELAEEVGIDPAELPPESGDKTWVSVEIQGDPAKLERAFETHLVEDGAYVRQVDRHPSSKRFVARVMAWIGLHDQKQKDYGTDVDPFANIREGARQLGLPAWVGCVIRMNDKMRRLNTAAKQYIETGETSLANEGVLDSFDDLGVYSGIGAVCFEEEA